MEKVIKLYKKEGETPLECLKGWKRANPEYENVKMTYAGRLDPMAEGLLLILAGEAIKEKDVFLGLPKVYESEFLLGVSTDTYDILGMVKQKKKEIEISEQKLKRILSKFHGKQIQSYPPYSSKTYLGKPLFALARKGVKLILPDHEIEIFKIEILSQRRETGRNLLSQIEERVLKVKGDFRQLDILSKWKHTFSGDSTKYSLIKLRIHAGSGTYIRVLAHDLGKILKVPALAYSIKRTKIGDFEI